MNILHTIPRFPFIGGDTVVGGSASVLYSLSTQQAKTHSITIVSQMLNNNIDGANEILLRHIDIDARASTLLFVLKYSIKIVREAVGYSDVDIVHMHSGFAEYFLAGLLLQAKVDIPVLHSLYCPLAQRGLRAYIVRLFVKLVASISAIHFICISENIATSLRLAGVGSSQISVVPPAVNVERFSQQALSTTRKENRKALSLPVDSPILLFVGNQKAEKNLETVLRAFKLLLSNSPDAFLVVTTELKYDGQDKRVLYLLNLVEELTLSSHIHWIGITDEMPQLMAAADIVVTPFIHTIGPSDYFIAAIEAMAAGTPVVVSSVGGMKEVVDKTRGRLIDPGSPDDIFNAFIELLGNQELRQKLGRNAQEYALENFNPQSVAKKMEAIYQKILKTQ